MFEIKVKIINESKGKDRNCFNCDLVSLEKKKLQYFSKNNLLKKVFIHSIVCKGRN